MSQQVRRFCEIDFKHADCAAQRRYEYASLLSGTEWAYGMVRQKELEKQEPGEFSDLAALEPAVMS